MKELHAFYQNIPQREAVKLFMIEQLKQLALDEVFTTKGDVKGYYEGMKAIEKCFIQLEKLYGEKKKAVIINTR